MTLSTEARKYMDMRDSLSLSEVGVVDAAFDSIYENMGMADLKAATDYRAAELEAAIIKFIIESREG